MAEPLSPLHRLATEAGLQIDWEDAAGQPQRVSDAALRRVLGALGLPAESDVEAQHSLAAHRANAADCAFVSADRGAPFRLPPGLATAGMAALELEDGTSLEVELIADADGLRVPPIDAIGYHRLRSKDREIRLAIAPPRCFSVADAAPGGKPWGAAVQVPSLRDTAAHAFGDFGTLAGAARALAASGADALAISPTHALFPADARRFSPYAPSSRMFLNILFGDPGMVGHPMAPAEAGALIDWEHAIPERIATLRAAYAGRSDAVAEAVGAYRAAGGTALERHATFDALHTRFFAQGATGWQQWPAEYHDPESADVARYAAQHAAEVDFFVFAQWLAKQSLDAAQTAAKREGMAIGLISDLAVGMDPGGSHAWSDPDALLSGLSIGAPPDLLGPDGQDWGITGFSPFALRRTAFEGFIATLRAGLDHAGGIRIDHALGLRRLWVVPNGASSAEGAYLRYPLEDMLRILAIESHRARAVVIGEDLGTVPPGLRDRLEAREILGMRVLWFERDAAGDFTPPARWDRQAVAMTGTHDLATVAGWWCGRDIDWRSRISGASPGSVAEAREDRDADRARLWRAFRASGAAATEAPASDEPAPAVDAAVAHVGEAACALALFPIEDLLGLVEQPNLPGTTDEHPNWRRRMPDSTDRLLARPEVATRIDTLNRTRKP